MNYLILFLLPFLAVAGEAANPRDATSEELVKLVEKTAAGLQGCAELKRNHLVEVEVSNKTEDYIDKAPLIDAFQRALKLKGASAKFKLQADLSSAKSQSGGKFASAYTLTAKLLKGEKAVCQQSESFTKSGSL